MSSFEGRQLRLRVQRIRELSGRGDPRAVELQRQVRSLLRRAGLREFPYDLERLADALGVQHILRRPLGIRGRLIEFEGAIAVEIDDRLAPQDARFVLAHELAHLIVEPHRVRGGMSGTERQSDATSYAQVERYCDFVAEEIVLPGEIAVDALGDAPALSVAIAYSEDVCVPLRVVLSRALREGRWGGQAVMWLGRKQSPTGYRFRPKWLTPPGPGVNRKWALVGPTTLGGVWDEPGTVFQVEVDLEDPAGAPLKRGAQAVAFKPGELWTLLASTMPKSKAATPRKR